MKLQKFNISTKDKPKMEAIKDYWDEQMVYEVTSLLKEHGDLFPKIFTELKGIDGYLGEIKIVLKPNSKLVKHQWYRLNPRVKQKVKKEIDLMLSTCLIFLVDELDQMSLDIIQRKKYIEKIRVCVDYHSLNFACVHDSFPTLFSDEVLEQVAGN